MVTLMLYRLVILSGPLSGQRITVEREPMTIGRSSDASLVLPDEEVALRHAVIEHSPTGLVIRDLGSMNRILVNKREVREAKLKHSDVVEIGRTQFLVQASVQAEVTRCAGDPECRRRRGALVALLLVAAAGAYWVNVARKSESVVVRGADVPPQKALPPVAPAPAQVAASPVNEVSPLNQTASPVIAERVAEPVSDEIREMREQLADIRTTVKDLAAKERAPSPTSLPYPMVDPIRQKTQAMLEDARKAAEGGRFADADQMLVNIQILDPDLLDTYLQRAALFEKRGMLKKAVEQWTEIVNRTAGTPLHDRAVENRARVEKLDREQAAETGRLIHIEDVEPLRFPQSAEFDEMRTLKIMLKPDGANLDADAVRVTVVFFDEDTLDGRVVTSRFDTSSADLRVEGSWNTAESKVVTATYAVPKGFRAHRPEQFYGYRIEVYYHGILQDATARPKNLNRNDSEDAGAPERPAATISRGAATS